MHRLLILILTLTSIAYSPHTESKEPKEPTGDASSGVEGKSFVSGIGGFFFRAENPEVLAKWYHNNIGIHQPPKSYDDPVWRQEAGTTIFHAFKKDSTFFGNPEKQFMLNFRVYDLDAIVEHLRKNKNKVEVDPTIYPNGRFALTHDPEGNPIQLWEPNQKDSN